MSYYGGGQGGGLGGLGQGLGGRQTNQGSTNLTAAQLFSQLQFGGTSYTADAGSAAAHVQLVHQQTHGVPQPQSGFGSLNVNFLTDHLAAASAGGVQTSVQPLGNLSVLSPMTITSIGGVGYQVTQASAAQQQRQNDSSPSSGQKQKVFTGSVTKIQDNYGLIDDDVFFQMGVVQGPILPKIGDRVIVEAEFNPTTNSPYKWSANHVMICGVGGVMDKGGPQTRGAPPPPIISQSTSSGGGVSMAQSNFRHGGAVSSGGIYSQGSNSHVGYSSVGGGGDPRTSVYQQQLTRVGGSALGGPLAPRPRGLQQQLQQTSGAMMAGVPMQLTVQDPLAQLTQQHYIQSGGGTQQKFHNDGFGGTQGNLEPKLSRDHESSEKRDRGREREREREREIQERQKGRAEREHEREKERDRERERERDRERERERERNKEREIKERERNRDLLRERANRKSRSRSGARDGVERKTRAELWREKEQERALARKEIRNASPTSSIHSRKRTRSPPQRETRDREREKEREKQRVKDKDNPKSKPQVEPTKSTSGKPESNENSLSTKGHSRSTSGPPLKIRPPSRYSVETPDFCCNMIELSVCDLKRRYSKLYIPGDFFLVRATWMESFPVFKPLDLNPCTTIHIFRKHKDSPEVGYFQPSSDPESPAGTKPSVFKVSHETLFPPDVSRTFSVKVILMPLPGKDSLHRKAGALTLGSDSKNVTEAPEKQHLSRLIQFVVGVKIGKSGDVRAIGGAWSPSLDGNNPSSDPEVLINTAKRTVKGLTGVDLSGVKEWYRFMEVYYRRANGVLETVVIFLPDLTPCVPSTKEWMRIGRAYKLAICKTTVDEEKKKAKPGAPIILKKVKSSTNDQPGSSSSTDVLKKVVEDDHVQKSSEPTSTSTSGTPAVAVIKKEKDDDAVTATTTGSTGSEEPSVLTNEGKSKDKDHDSMEQGDKEEEALALTPVGEVKVKVEKSDDSVTAKETSPETTPQSKVVVLKPVPGGTGNGVKSKSPLDPKLMNVVRLKEELALRGESTKGLKLQLIQRLTDILAKEELQSTQNPVPEEEPQIDENSKTQEPTSELITPQNGLNVSSEVVEDEVMDVSGGDTGAADILQIHTNPQDYEVIEELMIDPDEDQDESEGQAEVDISEEEPVSETHPNSEVLTNVLVPILPDTVDDKTRRVWERRYGLPKRPHILIHPSNAVKGGDFDCEALSLSALKDYRIHYVKEQTFEVSLFAEFFHEMISRDFAFRIYVELLTRVSALEGSNEDGLPNGNEKPKSGEDGAPENKKRKLSAASTGSSSKIVLKGGVETTPKTVTIDPALLQAFTYFDVGRGGYISDVDLEDLIHSIGLQLNRAHVRKLVQKVVEKVYDKRALNYRKWTDREVSDELPPGEEIKPMNTFTQEDLQAYAEGNKPLLPVFVNSGPKSTGEESSNDGHENEEAVIASLDGSLVNVRKMKGQIDSYEKERINMDANLNFMKNSLNEAKTQVVDLRKTCETLKDELTRTKESLKKLETSGKLNSENLEIFRAAAERFTVRVRDLIRTESKSSGNENDPNSSKPTTTDDTKESVSDQSGQKE